jgi:coenzyme F420 hydrogenase subunit beta
VTPSPALARVARGDLCAGCGACAAIASEKIAMRMTPPGFLRPEQRATLSPAEEEAVAAVCPGLRVEMTPPIRATEALWGPIRTCRTGHATDPALRHRASSGGVLSGLLTHLLATGAVDQVITTAADPDRPLGNRTVVAMTPETVLAAAGSRYAPSAPLAGIEAVLAGEGRAAFVGKPCDVAALRALARRDPRVEARIPYMLSFFCAGVPAEAGAEEVVRRLGAEPAEVTAFRYRGEGWPGRAVATLADGRSLGMSYADSWGSILSRHVQFRCKICADGVGALADVVCADAWDCDEAGYPLFAEAEGLSLVLSRTEKGEALVAAAAEAGRLTVEPLDPARIGAMQPSQAFRKRNLVPRLAALAALGRPRPDYRGFHLLALARKGRPRIALRNFLGTLRRAVIPRPSRH